MRGLIEVLSVTVAHMEVFFDCINHEPLIPMVRRRFGEWLSRWCEILCGKETAFCSARFIIVFPPFGCALIIKEKTDTTCPGLSAFIMGKV